MSSQIFCRRVNDYIDTVSNGILIDWRSKSIVNHRYQCMPFGQCSNSFKINNFHQRIARSFDIDDFGIRLDFGLKIIRSKSFGKAIFNAKFLEVLLHQIGRSTVEVIL